MIQKHRRRLLVPFLLPLLALAGCGGADINRSAIVATPTPTFPFPTPTGIVPTPLAPLTPPYRNKVVFVSRRGATERDGLYVMNPDGSQVTAINPLPQFNDLNLLYPGNHFMSADGSKFLFTFDQGTGSGTINYLVNADGTNARQITQLLNPNTSAPGTNNATGRVSDVSFSPDGARLVFPYSDSTNFTNSATLVTMNIDGSARTTRYNAPADQLIVSPIFAPDGQTIYFAQQASFGATTGTIYRLAPGASAPTAVTTFAIGGADAPFVFTEISINSDGTKLAFASYVDGSGEEIFTVGTDGTGLVRLTTNTSVDKSPAFTFDGTKIIFTSLRDGNSELYSMNPDGTATTRLTYEVEPDEEPTTRAARKNAVVPSSRKATQR